jgi:hypothetical protein
MGYVYDYERLVFKKDDISNESVLKILFQKQIDVMQNEQITNNVLDVKRKDVNIVVLIKGNSTWTYYGNE